MVTLLFYKFEFKENLLMKTMIELRPYISGHYKGLIYCSSLDQAKAVKYFLDIDLRNVFKEETTAKIKRGCSEYSMQFPEYGKMAENFEEFMSFPKEWTLAEKKFDQEELIKPDEHNQSLPMFCLSDFYIIQKWIDYAKGLEDQSIKIFKDRPTIYEDIYQLARNRKEA